MAVNTEVTVFWVATLFGLEELCQKVLRSYSDSLDIVGTVYHLVIYMQSNKIHKVFQ